MGFSKGVTDVMDKYGLQGHDTIATDSRMTVVKKPQAKQDFVGNIMNTGAAAAGAVGNFIGGIGKTLAKPVVDIGKNYKTLQVSTELNKQNRVITDKMLKLQKDFKAGKIGRNAYKTEYQRLKVVGDNISKQLQDTFAGEVKGGEFGVGLGKSALTAFSIAAPFAAPSASLAAAAESGAPGLVGTAARVAGKTGQFAERALVGTSKENQIAAITGDIAKKQGIVGGIAKGQLVVKPTLESTVKAGQDISEGKYKDAAINLALTASGGLVNGPVGTVKDAASYIGGKGSRLINDTQGLFDVVKLKSGNSVNAELKAAKEVMSPSKYKKVEGILKVWEDLVRQEHGSTPLAMKQAVEKYQPKGAKFDQQGLDEFVGNVKNFLGDRRRVQRLTEQAGLKAPEGTSFIAARLSNETKAIIAKRIEDAPDMKAEIKALQKDGLLKNKNLTGTINDIVDSSENNQQAAKQIRSLVSSRPVEGAEAINAKLGNGYFLGAAKNAGVVKTPNAVADITEGSKAKLGFVGRALDKTGLSVKSADPQEQKAIFNKVKTAFVDKVNQSDIPIDGKSVINKLNAYTDKTTGVFDIRQLRGSEVSEALGSKVTDAQAKSIIKMYKDSFSELSLAERGLGGKITDFNLSKNPLAAPYSRIQSVFRYEVNPGFRAQENIETKLGVKALSGKNAKFGEDYSSTIGLLKDKRILSGGYGSSAASDISTSSRMSAKLSRSQERNLSAGIEAFAGSKDPKVVGKWLDDPKNSSLLQEFKTVVQYPDKGITSSNLMKALNLVTFPMRYNIKVTKFAVDQLAKAPGATQVAVLRGIHDFNKFQNSPEGVKWAAKNSEVLGLIKYFTPIGSIDSVMKVLGGDAKTVRDYGTIGGLPFGVISSILQGQGVINTDSPYLNPKTGEVVPSQIPQDTKARLEQALNDIIGTMFTYPGRVINAPAKKDISTKIVSTITGGQLEGGKYASNTRTDITKDQARKQAILGGGKGTGKYNVPTIKNMPAPRKVDNTGGASNVNFVGPRFPKATIAKAKKGKTYAKSFGSKF